MLLSFSAIFLLIIPTEIERRQCYDEPAVIVGKRERAAGRSNEKHKTLNCYTRITSVKHSCK